MMKTGKYIISAVLIILSVLILNIILGLFRYSSSGYFSYSDKVNTYKPEISMDIIIKDDYEAAFRGAGDVFTETRLYTKNMVQRADSMFAQKRDYQMLYDELKEEYNEYERGLKAREIENNGYWHLYRAYFSSREEAAEIAGNISMSRTQIEKEMEYLSYCLNQLSYVRNYNDYISGIRESAEVRSRSSLYSESQKKQYNRTGMDFYRLENAKISAVSDDGVILMYSDTVTHFLSVVMTVCCALIYVIRFRSRVGNDVFADDRFALFSIIAAAGIILLYFSNMCINSLEFPYESAGAAVQSYRCFYSCPYMINLGGFNAVCTAFKTAAFMTVFFMCVTVFLNFRSIKYMSLILLCAAAEYFMFSVGIRTTVFSAFNAENIAGNYGITSFFGYPVSLTAAMTVHVLLLLGISFFTALKSVKLQAETAAEEAEKEYFDEITEKYNEARQIRHDIRNHLSVISIMLDSGDTEEARKYISEITAETDKVKAPVKTGSRVLDALLFRKYSQAEKINVKIETEFLSDFSGCGITDYDMCTVFSNVLDNAVEASARVIEEKRCISLKVKDQMNMLCIICENYYTDLIYSAGNIVTVKDDRINHGIGLKRIKRVAEKYGGAVNISADNHIFTISVLMMKQK